MNKLLSRIGSVLPVLLASLLVVLGITLSFVTYESSDPRNKFVPLDGFLLTTLGMGLFFVAWRLADKLGVAKLVESISGLTFSFFGILALLGLVISVGEQHHWPAGLPPAGLVWLTLAVLETQVALAWLLVKGRGARKAAANNGKPS